MERPWVKTLEQLGIPQTLEPYPKHPLYDFLEKAARDFPKHIACVYLGNEITYKDVKLEADKLAAALSDLGVRQGDRVATILPTSAQFVICDNAILKAGAAVVPCSTLHKASDLEYELEEAGVKTVICIESNLHLLSEIQPKLGLENIIVTALEDYSATEKPIELPQIEGANVCRLRGLINKYPAEPPRVEIDPERALSMVPFTGGATGLPKGVMLTHYNMTSNVYQIEPVFSGLLALIRGNAAMMLALPFFHQYGHWAMYVAIHGAATMLLVPDPRDYDMIWDLTEKYHPLLQIGIPTQYMRMLSSDKAKKLGMLGASGSAALPPEVAEKYEETAGGVMTEGYGLTETSPVTHVNVSAVVRLVGSERMIRMTNTISRIGLVKYLAPKLLGIIGRERLGRIVSWAMPHLTSSASRPERKEKGVKASIGIPVPDTDVRVVDVETGEDVPLGGNGEMLLKGPQVMLGYWPTPGKGLEEGWLRTGDIVRVDDRGFCYVVDRTKDMANISGYKVYTRLIDDILYEHPAVEMAAAVGIPDPERPGSERIKAFIMLKEGYKGKVSPEEIIEFCRPKLPPYAVPKFVEFRDEMPLTVTEKVFKRHLREEEMRRMGMT